MDKDSQNQTTAPVADDQAVVTDDQALADALEGMNKRVSALEEPSSGDGSNPDELQFEATPVAGAEDEAADETADDASPESSDPAEPKDTEATQSDDDMILPPVTTPDADTAEAVTEDTAPTAEPAAETPEPVVPDMTLDATAPLLSGSDTGELDTIKRDALSELRPLVDKLDLPPEEKFDTLLLIIRSTDDKSLVTAAHEAAKSIPDETRRANALLDIIKEIDYFSNQQAA